MTELTSLKERIMRDGKCLPGGILKVDSFINHQFDPALMMKIGEHFAQLFKDSGFNKILTIEASGIAPALTMGIATGLPVAFVKKAKPSTMSEAYTSEVHSFTKGTDCTVSLSKEFLSAGDRVVIIDDFLAYGEASMGMINIAKQAGASVAGLGFIIEKSFQGGGKLLREQGYRVESLVIIDSLDNCEIKMR